MTEYIEREAVYRKACKGCTRHGDEVGSCSSEEPCDCLLYHFVTAPAADVAPVVHGRWIAETERMGNYSHCSECGCRCQGYTPHYNYCPNCGAKMDA